MGLIMYNNWKYIVTEYETEDKELSHIIVIFPRQMIHADVSFALEHCESVCFDSSYPVGAGFLDIDRGGMLCYGKSESLDVDSRDPLDSNLLTNTISYQYLVFPYTDSAGYKFEYPVIFSLDVNPTEFASAIMLMPDFRRNISAPVRGGKVQFCQDMIFCSEGISELNIESSLSDGTYIDHKGAIQFNSGLFLVAQPENNH